MARHAALELRAIDADLTAKHDALMLQAQRYSESRSKAVDPQAAIDAYVDAEMAAEAARAQHLAVVDDCTELLYGPHARAGVAKLLGAKYADVLNQRWLQLRTWAAIARDMGVTVRWAQMCGQAAIDWMDETGESQIRAFNAGEEEFIDALRAGCGR